MESLGSFSGIISGFDSRTLVDQIIQLERRPADRIQGQINDNLDKTEALADLRSRLAALESAVEDLRDGSAFKAAGTTVSGQTTGGSSILTASPSVGATPGSYEVEVLTLARAEKVSSQSFSSAITALGLAGEFYVNGKRITVEAFDTLNDVREKLSTESGGSSGVLASVLSNGSDNFRLILTRETEGAGGVDLVDGTEGLLQSLGFVDGTTAIKHDTSSGAESDRFSSSSSTVKGLLSVAAAVGPTTIVVAGQNVDIDLSTESLTDIAANIDALTGVTAQVLSEVNEDGDTDYYLDIRGTTSFADSGHILELLGVVEGGRSASQHSVQGDVLTDGDGSTPASGATLLTNVWHAGSTSSVQVGDTIDIDGVRGDGSTISLSHTVGGADTITTLLTLLNNATDGFGAGSRTATASVDASGRIVVTDDTAGSSLVSLSLIANNEGGGTLDFGTFEVAQDGYDRQVTDGTNASFRVDGINFSRSTNTISDAIPDITLGLMNAEAGSTASVTVERNAAAAVAAAEAMVDQFNETISFVKSQRAAVGEEVTAPPLSGDSMLRVLSSSLTTVMVGTLAGLEGDFTRLSAAGIEIGDSGELAFDSGRFETAFDDDFASLRALFVESGATSTSQLDYVGSTSDTAAGTYSVDVTTAAAQAALTGAGFSGTYADDGTADTMSVTDTAGYVASISLANGMTTAQIVSELNTAFDSTAAHQLESDTTLYSDAGATTPISAATLFQDLHDSGGATAGVSNGDTIAYSGKSVGGLTFAYTYTVDDVATTTVGDLIGEIQGAIGSNATVTITNGKITVAADSAGLSQLELTVTANNEGGGSLDMGTVATTVVGKSAMALEASASGNEVVVTHDEYGSVEGFDIAFIAGGADGTGQLGLAAAAYRGTDIVGTIGGFAATGSGRTLVGDSGTAVAALQVSHAGGGTGTIGTVTLALGIGALVERTLGTYLNAGTGILDLRTEAMTDRNSSLENRLDSVEARIERYEELLLERFAAMEVLISQLSAQQASFASQVGSIS